MAVVAVMLLALGGGLAVWWQQTRHAAPRAALPDLPPGAVERALEAAAADSLALKTRWVDEVPDIDLGALAPARRAVFLRFVNARHCTCGCGYTLGACRNFDPACEVSGPLVAALFDSVAAGFVADATGLRERPGADPGQAPKP